MKNITIGILALVCFMSNAKACEEALLYKKVSELVGMQVAAAEYGSSTRFESKANVVIYISYDDNNGDLGTEHIQFVTSVRAVKGNENLLSSGKINSETCEIERKWIGGGARAIKITPFPSR